MVVTTVFVKYQALGNDFLLFDWRGVEGAFPCRAVPALCDRRRGVGADGVLVLLRGRQQPHSMTVINADGSPAEMCGNGLCCLLAYLRGHDHLEPAPLSVETDSGTLLCRIGNDRVTIRLDPAVLGRFPRHLTVAGKTIEAYEVSVGNPHAVLFGAPRESLARAAQRLYPDGVNVGFVSSVGNDQVELQVFERGVGMSEACGTGAAAACAVLTELGRVDVDSSIHVQQPGGATLVRVLSTGIELSLQPVKVFRGEVVLGEFVPPA